MLSSHPPYNFDGPGQTPDSIRNIGGWGEVGRIALLFAKAGWPYYSKGIVIEKYKLPGATTNDSTE